MNTIATSARTTATRIALDPEVDDVAIAHHVLLAFDGELARFTALRLSAELHVILPPDDLGFDESLFEVSVNHACSLRSPRALEGRPRFHLFLPCREECQKLEDRVARSNHTV